MNRPITLTRDFVRVVREPGRYSDGPRAFGLSLLVKASPRGGVTKSWTQRLRVNRRWRYLGLGSYPLVPLPEAREVALANARLARSGGDPLFDREQSTIPTFREAAEQTIEKVAAGWKEGRSGDIWRSRLDLYVYPLIGDKRLDLVTSQDVLRIIARLWPDKRETARKVKQYLGSVMAWGIAEGYRADNPAANERIGAALPRPPRQVQHLAALPVEELPRALAKVKASNAGVTTKAAIEYLILTAARSGEVRAAMWDEVDLANRSWFVPPEHHKMGREHRVPLSQAALDVLSEVAEYSDGSGLIFPSPRGKVLSDATLSKLFRELGLKGTPHGCRATFRTWAAESGADSELAEFSLGHVAGTQVERAYQRSDLFEARRELMESWAAMLKEG